MTIIEIIEFIRAEQKKSSELGNQEVEVRIEEYKNILYKHYIESLVRFKELNQDIENIEEIYITTIKLLCDIYINGDYSRGIHNYLRYNLERMTTTKKWGKEYFESIDETSQSLVLKAKEGDKEAKKQLIERYMRLVKVDETMSEDDIQNGYLILAKLVNNYISNDVKTYISVYLAWNFDRYFTTFLESESKKENKLNLLYGVFLKGKDDFEKNKRFNGIKRYDRKLEC